MCVLCICVCVSVHVCVCACVCCVCVGVCIGVCVGVCGGLREKLSCGLHVLSSALHRIMHACYVRDRPWCKRSSKYVCCALVWC